jgi:ADP-dependent NAD(P)H-hydrate dehydratase / NAD(P)H-hydrate epimerase
LKVLTAAQMREVDRRTIELGIPGLILMENAAQRVMEFLVETFPRLAEERIVVLCGKGNNGGDGLAIARQLHIRIHPRSLDVVLAAEPSELRGDAAENYRMLMAAGCPVQTELAPGMQAATLIVDAILGTGLKGTASGRALEWINAINNGFPSAEVVAVDVPSGLDSDSGKPPGEAVHAGYTITFTAPKPCHVLAPACDNSGKLRVAPIGSPPDLFDKDSSIYLALSEPREFRHLLLPRSPDSNKGTYGHVLVIAGARGKTGAAAMAGVAALRAGAGLSTVASAESAITAIASYSPEIMTEPLPETESGSIALHAVDRTVLGSIAAKKNVIAIGPGMGDHPETVQVVQRIVNEWEQPMVVDADALNALASVAFRARGPRVLTPHPGEMSRLMKKDIADIQANRIEVARAFAQEHGVHLVLKGHQSVIAAPDGRVWINPTGSPALATGGTGDVLTGMIAGLLAQFPDRMEAAILAAVYLHGRAGQLGAAKLGEKCFIATDIFQFLPEAMREAADLSNAF